MNENQTINCTVTSCKFNDAGTDKCILKQITVEPTLNNDTGDNDESMCGSYKNNH